MTKNTNVESDTPWTLAGGRNGLRIARLARQIYEGAQARVYAGLTGEGFPEIRPAHSAIFRNIDPTGTRASDLAQRAGITKQSVAYLVEGLETDGFVESVPDPEDGRARLIRLTARGRAAFAALVRLSEAVDAEFGAVLPEGRLEVLRSDLAAIAAHIGA
jgi:DNA-binding MarR family transcriptional regulator